MEKTLLLSHSDIAACLTMPKCIELVDQVFKAHGQGNAVMPPKLKLIMDETEGWANAMPGFLKDINAAGLKWAGGWERNPSRGLPYIMAEMFLIDPETGRLKAVLDAGFITDLRTGAATAVAAQYLARKDVASIAIIGAGAQGRMQLRALRCAYEVEDIRVTDCYPETAREFANAMSAELGITVQPFADIRSAVDGADIIVTATTADEALLQNGWISPGAFIASVGSYPELDPELVMSADKIIVDSWEQNCVRGELFRLIEQGRLTREEIHGEMGDVAAGNIPGRNSDQEVIVAALIGLGTHDVACAAHVFDIVIHEGRGSFFDFQQAGE
ncbi:MAG: ornithine cyclodeaminase family protein [Desulfobacteraceae bacterium]|jgi:ornithine cyclodeaminase/alanine dehydrogenase-like protein (mu-crystallin family)